MCRRSTAEELRAAIDAVEARCHAGIPTCCDILLGQNGVGMLGLAQAGVVCTLKGHKQDRASSEESLFVLLPGSIALDP